MVAIAVPALRTGAPPHVLVTALDATMFGAMLN
jgi:hypothetical protein